MLNYAETTRSRTNVSFTPVPCSQPQVSITEPLSPVAVPLPPSTAEEEREQGREAGRTEFKHLHEQAEQHKGEALTKPEIREVYGTRFLERMQEYERGDLPRDWFEGWCRGIVSATIQAEGAVPLEPVAPDLPLPEPLPLTPVRFRQAIFEVEDAEAFLTGVQCGQVCAVEETQGG